MSSLSGHHSQPSAAVENRNLQLEQSAVNPIHFGNILRSLCIFCSGPPLLSASTVTVRQLVRARGRQLKVGREDR